jgi:class 3 adenylate cyclase
LLDRGVALKLEIQGIDPGGVQRSIYAVATSLRRAPPDLYEHASPDGTVTLMFSDMEGFTEMTERLGDQAAHVVIQRHNAIVREQLQIHAGYEVELQGDGFLLAFKGARSALLCAMGIQRALAAHNDAHADQPIRVRIGLHTGEAIKDADKFFGRTVIQAYRIADQARSGEILVSSLLKELVQTSADLRFGEAREIELKGLSGKHLVFAAEWR